MLYLAPSPIHGVGVFTSIDIGPAVRLPLFAPRDWQALGRLMPSGIQARYCTEEGGIWYGPKNWNRMSIGWYLNNGHSAGANVSALDWTTLRPINKGEELLVDYRLFDNRRVSVQHKRRK